MNQSTDRITGQGEAVSPAMTNSPGSLAAVIDALDTALTELDSELCGLGSALQPVSVTFPCGDACKAVDKQQLAPAVQRVSSLVDRATSLTRSVSALRQGLAIS